MEWLTSLLTSDNQFFTGGLMLGILAGILAYLRNVPHKIYYWIKRYTVTTMLLTDNDPATGWIFDWLDEHTEHYVRGFWSLRTVNPGDYGERPDLRISLAPGWHIIWFKGWPLWFDRTRRELESKAGSNKAYEETVQLSTLCWGKEFIYDFVATARDASWGPPSRGWYWVYRFDSGWYSVGKGQQRSLDNVFWPEGQLHRVIQDVDKFIADGDWYEQHGLPHRRGYLFAGPPGCGKTTAVAAIASHLELNVYTLSLASGLNDAKFAKLVEGIPSRCVLLIEDIDCAAVTQRRRGDDEEDRQTSITLIDGEMGYGLTLSGILNALDGITRSAGRLVIMTSNHPEKLDPALIRPGRVDLQVHLPAATNEQALNMATALLDRELDPKETQQLLGYVERGKSMADIQAKLLRAILSPDNPTPPSCTVRVENRKPPKEDLEMAFGLQDASAKSEGQPVFFPGD